MSKGLSEELSLKLLCDASFPSLPGQSDITCFTMVRFQLDDHPWQQNFSNHNKLKCKTINYIPRSYRKAKLKDA